MELLGLFLGSILFALSFIIQNPVIIAIAYILLSYKLFINVVKNFKIDENLLMVIASLTALIIGEYKEALAVIFLYQIGEALSDYQVDKSKKNIVDLMNLKADIAHLKNKDVNPKDVKIGDIITVKTGEVIPLDGTIVKGSCNLDMKSLTGEAKPKSVNINDYVLSGAINLDGLIDIKVDKLLEESTAKKILKIIEDTEKAITKKEKFITKFAKIYTPIIIVIALLLIVIPLILNLDVKIWVNRALIFLVTSCPCALVISIPLGYFCGIGSLSKKGILVKGANILEELENIKTVALDKTGTITRGIFEVDKIIPYQIEEDELLSYTAYAEYNSNHPIAISIKNKYGKKINPKYIKDYEELAGLGIKVNINGDSVIVGNNKLFKKEKIVYPKIEFTGTTILVALNNTYIGTIVINDKVKDECLNIVDDLKKLGIKKVVMLSGDEDDIVKKLGKKLSFDIVQGDLLPDDKLAKLNQLKEENKTLFVGDGINDAACLLACDIGVSMGSIGSDAAIMASDIIIMDDNPTKIITAYNVSKKTKKIVIFNIYLALITKFLCLFLGLIGITNMWLAVLADVGVTLIAILNALRIYKS